MSNDRGLSLIETLVALVISVVIVLSTGLLGTRMFHRRSSSASISVATALAEKRIEELRPPELPWTGTGKLEVGETETLVDATGVVSVGGPYRLTVNIENGPSAGTAAMKKVTVTVQHVTNTEVRVQLATYFRVTT